MFNVAPDTQWVIWGRFLQANQQRQKTLKDKMVCWDTQDQSHENCRR